MKVDLVTHILLVLFEKEVLILIRNSNVMNKISLRRSQAIKLGVLDPNRPELDCLNV